MLPLCQSHPQAVPPFRKQDLDSRHGHLRRPQRRTSLASDPSLTDLYSATHDVTSRPRSFPIRTSLPSTTLSASGLAQPEHHLRRKTPSGTLDAGYDGSLGQLYQGLPPSKQIIVPVPANRLPGPVPAATFPSSRLAQTPGPSLLASFRYVNPQPDTLLHPPELCDDDRAWQGRPWHPTNPSHLHAGTPVYTDNHHIAFRPSERNVRAFCPPPSQPPLNEPLSSHQVGWQHAYTQWDHHSHGPSLPVRSDQFLLNQSSTSSPQYALTPLGYPGSGTVPLGSFQDFHNSHLSAAGLDRRLQVPAGIIEDTSSISPRTTQAGFKEKALSQAHKAYIELLAHLQASKKWHHSKSDTRLPKGHASCKLPMYPKPPRPISMASSSRSRDSTLSMDHVVGLDPQTLNSQYSKQTTVQGSMEYGPRVADLGFAPRSQRQALAGGASPFEALGHTHAGPATAWSIDGSGRDFVGESPVSRAKLSLEVLQSLCEQSNWRWTEGMLLGGCLQYGLERYDTAAHWFSKILNSDSSHVEAAANMAAALYCMNRQQEAEQFWLRAVKLRPSYLEAAEHLVGLLYKKRSEDAIEVIGFVQKSLLIDQQDSQHEPGHTSGGIYSRSTAYQRSETHGRADGFHQPGPGSGSSDHDGWGSSGYALPGSENGRILALVHAKGTMLYGLKDIKKASDAFEEAVLISVGCHMSGIQGLVSRIQMALAPQDSSSISLSQEARATQSLLLPPERARHTAQLVFPKGAGILPGLEFVSDGSPRRAAIQTTSNSLLSLAKIYQDAMSTGNTDAGSISRPSGIGDILALYYLSLSLQESPSTANNVGILLAGIPQTGPAAATATASGDLHSQPNIPGIPPRSGLAYALAYYQYGLSLDPSHVHLHTNLGSLLKDIGQLDLAIQMYERAVTCDGTFDIALTNLANAVKDRGRINDAISYYRRAVGTNPHFAEAVCGLFTALNSVCDWRGRGGVVFDSNTHDRWHVDEKGMLLDSRWLKQGSGLTQRVSDIVDQQLEEASKWGRQTLQGPVLAMLVRQIQPLFDGSLDQLRHALESLSGKPWEGSLVIRLIERATRVTMHRWYQNAYGRSASIDPNISRYSRLRLPANLAIPPAPTVLPFHTFTTPLRPKAIRSISQRNAMRISCTTLRLPWLPTTVYRPPPPPNPHLNVGYLSSDFNNHPLAHLMQSVFGLHDSRRARAICYATTPSDKSAHRQQIEREAPVFRDVSGWPSEKIVDQIVKDQIHVLVNLNGYTRGARNEVFAARPAPIQMSFMGFAGSLGAEWCDYILADTTAIPPTTLRRWRNNVTIGDVLEDAKEADEDNWMFSENIIFCRDTFFCCDHAQSCSAGERGITWQEEKQRRWQMRKDLFPDLADDVVIMGNFNQLYKIEPTTFRCWLRILSQVPKAILWLLRFPELGERNLRRTAVAWAGAEVASRLRFTDVAPKSHHISRARVCDLFLDTPECNAHTTAADVLWSSTPLLTLPRYSHKMCSRMAASILKGALPKTPAGEQMRTELISTSEEEYEKTAVWLANGLEYQPSGTGYAEGSGRLAEMRKILWESKWGCGLFDTRRWVSEVEAAYEEAWRRWVAGEGGDIYL